VAVRQVAGVVEFIRLTHGVTALVDPLAAQTRRVYDPPHGVQHDPRMADRPSIRIIAMHRLVRQTQLFALIPPPPDDVDTAR
jgi:hypothetical protein